MIGMHMLGLGLAIELELRASAVHMHVGLGLGAEFVVPVTCLGRAEALSVRQITKPCTFADCR